MNKVLLSVSVDEAVARIKSFLDGKDFEIFAHIDHKANASAVNLDMPNAQVLLFGNPIGGTKLMQKDIYMSFDLPIRVAVVEDGDEVYFLHQSNADYSGAYDVAGHTVLDKMEGLFAALTGTLTA